MPMIANEHVSITFADGTDCPDGQGVCLVSIKDVAAGHKYMTTPQAGWPQPPATPPPGIPLRTLDGLRDYAAGHGITIPALDQAETPPHDTLTTPPHRKLTLIWNAYIAGSMFHRAGRPGGCGSGCGT